MSIQTSYSYAKANLAKLWDEVIFNRKTVIIKKDNLEEVALISVSELKSLQETAHLLKSPQNAERLLTALKRAKSKKIAPQTIEELKREVGFE